MDQVPNGRRAVPTATALTAFPRRNAVSRRRQLPREGFTLAPLAAAVRLGLRRGNARQSGGSRLRGRRERRFRAETVATVVQSLPFRVSMPSRMTQTRTKQAPARTPRRDIPVVEFEEVTKVYDGGSIGLERASMKIDRGEFVFLVGPTGCGKSTCIRLLQKELEPSKGQIRIAGRA